MLTFSPSQFSNMGIVTRTRPSILPIIILILVSLVGEFSAHIMRSSCNRDVKFDNIRPGYRLSGHVLETVQVARAIDCVIKCAEHVSCESVNYNQDTTTASNPCELNSKRDVDVTLTVDSTSVYYGPKILELNCTQLAGLNCMNGAPCVQNCQDENYGCQCPLGWCGITCADPDPFDVQFQRQSVEDYISIQSNAVADSETFTLLFWVNTRATSALALLSYGVTGSVNELLLVLDGEKLILTVQTVSNSVFYIPPVNDGFWHHFGIVRNLTEYTAFLDGVRLTSVSDLGTSVGLKGNGVFVIGQKMNAVGADFDVNVAFSGSLSQLNVWTSVLSDEIIKNASKACVSEEGDALSWLDVEIPLNGELVLAKTSNCRSLRGDTEYDIAMHTSPSSVATYAISPEPITVDMTGYTLAFWVKFSVYAAARLVYYSTSSDVHLKTEFSSNGQQSMYLNTKDHRLDVPYFTGDWSSWHHYSTTWSNSDGRLVAYLDGSMVAMNTEKSIGEVLPKGGKFVIGNYQNPMGEGMTASTSFIGGLSRVNIWDFALDGEAIWAMAKGPLLANGNLFAWFGIRQKAMGPVVFEDTPTDLRYQRDESDLSLGFLTQSAYNYATITDPFPQDLTQLGICFWAKFLSLSGQVVSYSTPSYSSEMHVYVYSSNSILLGMHNYDSQYIYFDIDPLKWNFYCINWKNTDGQLTYYINGDDVGGGTLRAGYTVAAADGILILGQEPDGYASYFSSTQAMHGHLAQLNIWSQPLPVPAILGMATGVMNVNGDLVQWRQFAQNIVGDLEIASAADVILPGYPTQKKRDAFCESRHPGYYARFSARPAFGYRWRCMNPAVLFSTGQMILDTDSQRSANDTLLYSSLATLF